MKIMQDPGGMAGGGAAVIAAEIARANSAAGGIVRLDPPEFQKILNRAESILVVHAVGGVFRKHFQYLTNYKGIFFFTKSKERLQFGHKVELVTAASIWIPS